MVRTLRDEYGVDVPQDLRPEAFNAKGGPPSIPALASVVPPSPAVVPGDEPIALDPAADVPLDNHSVRDLRRLSAGRCGRRGPRRTHRVHEALVDPGALRTRGIARPRERVRSRRGDHGLGTVDLSDRLARASHASSRVHPRNAFLSSDVRPIATPTVRTSLSHPLHIAELPCGPSAGVLGVTFCPGKQGASVFGAAWQRDLALDLDAIQDWGARFVVTLVETHELKTLGVPDLGEQIRQRGMLWLYLPIIDLQPPGPDFFATWAEAAGLLRHTLSAGGRVLVHCRGGLGRAGTVAACMLTEMGDAPEEAIARVRSARPGAIETDAQEQFVRRFRPPL